MKKAKLKFFAKVRLGRDPNFSARSRTPLGSRARKFLGEAVFFTILLLFSFWLMTHTFGYDRQNQSILIANKLWSDFGAHIPLIRSFSMGDNFALLVAGRPEYPIFPGEPIRYHFLFYALVGLLERLGIRIDWALNIPSSIGFFALLLSIYLMAKKLFGDIRIAILSVIFFLFNGSLGFIRFFENHPLSKNTLSNIVKNSAFPAFAPWGPGDISAFWNLNIYTNQRHLAAGFSITLFFIWTILVLEKKPWKKQLPWAIFWGVTIGILPYFHTPALVIMAVLFATYFFLFGKLRKFLIIGGAVAGALVIPQILRFPQGPKILSWYPGYLIHDQLTPLRFLEYWWNNLGLHSVLIPIGFFLIPLRAKKTLVPLLLIFLIANLFKFSVEVAASHKFFNFSLILGQMISAFVLVSVWRRLESTNLHLFIRLFIYSFISLYILFLTLTGIIDFFVVVNDRRGGIADLGKNEVVTWIVRNTPPSSTFLNSSFLYHPASLAGRKVFLGWPYFAWSAGYQSFERMDEMKLLYSSKSKPDLCQKLTQHGIDYVTYQNSERYPEIPFTNEETYRTNAPLVYESTSSAMRIYDVKHMCD